MQTLLTSPKIYVACLASYNNGILHGQWIEADQDAEAIMNEIQDMLGQSPVCDAEEWAIHDYEGFEGIRLSEYESIEEVARLAELVGEHGEAFAAYAGYVGSDYATAEGFREAYMGKWDSEEEYARHIAEETLDIPERLEFYMDYEKYARDLFINDYYSVDTSDFKVFVFLHI